MRPRSISFLRNSLSAYAPFLVDLILKMAIIRLILQQYGTELVGMWGILKSVLAIPLFLQEGVCFAIFLDRSGGKSESTLGDVVSFSAATGILIAAILFLFAPFFPTYFQIPLAQQEEMMVAFGIAAIAFAASAPAQAVLYSIRGSGRFDVVAVLLIVNSVLNFLLVYYFLARNNGIVGLISADLACAVLLIGSALWFHHRLFRSGASLFRWNFAQLWRLAKRAATQLFYSGTARAFWELDALLVARFFGIQTMASYWIGRRIPYVYGDFLWAGIWPAVPATQTEDTRETILERIHWLQAAILIPWAIFLFVVAPEILYLWTGLVDPLAILSMRILVFAVAFDFLPATAISFFFGRGKVLVVGFALFAALIAKTGFSLYACFTRQYELLLISTAASALLFCVLILFLLSRSTSISIFRMVRPVAAFLIASAFSLNLWSLLPAHHSFWSFLLRTVFFAALTYTASFFLLRIFYPQGFSAFVRFAVQNSNLFHFFYSAPYAFLRRTSLTLERFHEKRVRRFEGVYQAKKDPWDYETSEYERNKYYKMKEFLSHRNFLNALEIGCSEGLFTTEIAGFSTNVIGLDISPTAIARAREHSRGHNNIEIRHFDVVNDPIPANVDLICCGEVLNCLSSKQQLRRVGDKIVEALAPGGWLLLVNLHLFPDDRKGLVLKDMGFGSTHIRNLFAACGKLMLRRDEDHEGYRITLFEKKS